MNIGILSRGPQLYSTQQLWKAGQMRGHRMLLYDPTFCQLRLDECPAVIYEGEEVQSLQAIIPRIGASITEQGASVIQQFEMMGVYSTASSGALLQSRDKLRCLQRLTQAGIPVPRTVLVNQPESLPELLYAVGGMPVVIKLLQSTHGIGVLLAENYHQATSTIEAMIRLGSRVIVQEFIRESAGVDVRAFVVAGEVVAVMCRQAANGDFRSNLHRGATATPTRLSPLEEELVKKSVIALGIDVAGVDLLRSKRGPLIMEVNASPGLEGIETITGVDVAGKIIQHIEKRLRKARVLSQVFTEK